MVFMMIFAADKLWPDSRIFFTLQKCNRFVRLPYIRSGKVLCNASDCGTRSFHVSLQAAKQ